MSRKKGHGGRSRRKRIRRKEDDERKGMSRKSGGR